MSKYPVRVESAADYAGVALAYAAGSVVLPFLYAADWAQRGLERARAGRRGLLRLAGLAVLVAASSGCISYICQERAKDDARRAQEEAVLRAWDKAGKGGSK